MIFKHYTCETVDCHGIITGSRICRVPAWRSAKFAYDLMLEHIPNSRTIVNFRKVE